ncbi:MAG: primosomal protein N' [Vulcanimicrobiaceae bacterium]
MPPKSPEATASPAAARAVAYVDVFVQPKTARVDRALTYAVPAESDLDIGDIVRVPLGPRELYGFVISSPRAHVGGGGSAMVRPIAAHVESARAFDATGLALARWIAQRYCCSLGEALGPLTFAAALPRVVDRFVVAGGVPGEMSGVPPRLLRLLGDEFASGFGLDALLRHPEARRAGDRRALLAALGVLQRAGVVRRERTFVSPRISGVRERVLAATGGVVAGPRVAALVALVRERGTLRRRDALLAGYAQAIVARAIRGGALVETTERASPARVAGPRETQDFVATDEQSTAIDAILARVRARAFGEVLVQGVTGSGKTFVYLRAIARTLAEGGRAIVLVPEIALTPQTSRRFETVFGERVAVLHSGLSERERFESWHAAARGEIDVVVGARSAVFAPLPDVRLVVVDEAHERSYKQDTVPRYDAVAVARERMRLAGGTLVLGSATPPLEAYAAALEGRIAHVRLAKRATASALPTVRVVDLAAEFERGNRRIFSTALVAAIGARLAAGEKTVLFVNRRGSSKFMLCRACGAVPQCVRCSASLTIHRVEGLLRCHLCDAQRPIPTTCPACGSGPIREFGVGTQKVVEATAALFPSARIVRMDSDTTTRVGDHARLLDEFADRGDVLVGTQMVAKGLDFPTVTLVGVVAADIGLHAPDFRAAERTFDLLVQVAGRSGRTRPGEAIVQTYAPAHPAIVYASKHDFDGFATSELAARRELGYPPAAELVYVGVIGRSETAVVAAAMRYAELLAGLGECEVLGPAPYPIVRVNDEYRYRLAVKARDAEHVRRFLGKRTIATRERDVRVAINVDP